MLRPYPPMPPPPPAAIIPAPPSAPGSAPPEAICCCMLACMFSAMALNDGSSEICFAMSLMEGRQLKSRAKLDSSSSCFSSLLCYAECLPEVGA